MTNLMSPALASFQPHQNQHLTNNISLILFSQLRIQKHLFSKIVPSLARQFVLNL